MNLYQRMFYSFESKLLDDESLINYIFKFETALALSQSNKKLISQENFETIHTHCTIENINLSKLSEDIPLFGNVAIPILKQINSKIEQSNQVSYLHLGATSQDAIDTAYTLMFKAYVDSLLVQSKKLLASLHSLSHDHLDTVMMARTLMQQATPITFGLKVAKWYVLLQHAVLSIENNLPSITRLSLGGATGSRGPFLTQEICEEVASLLGLENDNFDALIRWPLLASQLGLLSGVVSKIAKDISILSQTEIAELSESSVPDKGGSSAMPHKQNQTTCLAILANAYKVPQLIATIYAALDQENERAMGGWQAQWTVMKDLLLTVGDATSKLHSLINGLTIHSSQMLHNVELSQGRVFAEAVSAVLTPIHGKQHTDKLVEAACKISIQKNIHLKQSLMQLGLTHESIHKAFELTPIINQCKIIVKEIFSKG